MSSSLSTSSSEVRGDVWRLGRFAVHAAAFALLPAIYVGTVALVDPFGFFGFSRTLAEPVVRTRVAKAINPTLLSLSEFRRRPAPNVLLGDSRMASLRADAVSRQMGKPVANLAYGGASMQEMIDSFWFATRFTKLESVTFGLTLDAYNDYNILRRTDAMESMISNPLLYFTNRNVLTATWYTLLARGWPGMVPALDKVTADRETYWRYVLDEQQLTFSRWRAPRRYAAELQRVALWCSEHGVRLTFVRFPTHRDVEAIVTANGLGESAVQMKRDLEHLARLVDFGPRTEITNERANYNDPVHFNAAIGAKLIAEIWP